MALMLLSCSKVPELPPKQQPHKKRIASLPESEWDEVLVIFVRTCQESATQKIYGSLCREAAKADDAKAFFVKNFALKKVAANRAAKPGLLTGYYEATIHASYTKSSLYRYPVYATPSDLLEIELGSIYPQLRHQIRGRLEGKKVLPYYTRAQAAKNGLNASVICYCDSKIDKFFLEVQGSGIAVFEDGSKIYLGYANSNGHRYRSIGRYMIEQGMIEPKAISLASIKEYLQKHHKVVESVLHYNNSLIFFRKKSHSASGALGIVLYPKRSVAVDRSAIPLGSMLYLQADIKGEKPLQRVVFAHDTGSAIKGSVRADLFCGAGLDAMAFAGSLKAPLWLWVFVPKKDGVKRDE